MFLMLFVSINNNVNCASELRPLIDKITSHNYRQIFKVLKINVLNVAIAVN